MPVMKEQELKKHIASKQFSNLYVLYGEEKMLVKMYSDLLIKKLVGNTPSDFNYHIFTSDNTVGEIALATQILPFAQSCNCVLINDYNFDSLDAEEFDELLSVLKDLPDTTVMIISMPTLDTDSKSGAKFKKISAYAEKKGVCANLIHRTELQLEKSLCKWAQNCGCTMSQITASKLIRTCTGDLNILHNELEKLCAYADGAEITPEMIDLLVTKNLEAKTYELFDYVIKGNCDKAMNTIDVLTYQKEDPVKIAVILASAYVDMYRAKVASNSHISTDEVAARFNYKKNLAWRLDKSLRMSNGMTIAAMRESLCALIDVNTRLVSTANNKRTELEKLISRLVLISQNDLKNR